jgi:methyl-CpG-binding domain protein 4
MLLLTCRVINLNVASYSRYAADAYAIFCAGRANEVVPKDHKLVDYWSYVCFELPSIQVGVSRKGLSITYELHYVVSFYFSLCDVNYGGNTSITVRVKFSADPLHNPYILPLS